jgi:hypothetical protein
MKRIQWSDITKAARETSEALNGEDWVGASIKARVLLADLADEVARLTAENDAVWDAIETLGDFLTSEPISEELKRYDFDVTRAFERVKAALRAKKDEELTC